MGKTLTILLSVLGAGLVSAPAKALDVTESPPPSPGPGPSKSYGGQIVAADFGALALSLAVVGATRSVAPAALTWSLGGPLVHVFHGHPVRAVGSFLLNLGLPLAGAFAGASIGSCAGTRYDETCAMDGLVLGAVVGIVVATTIDAAVLARLPDDWSPGTANGVAAQRAGASSAPAVAVGRNGDVTLGWRGIF